jgi:hypothetical protein
MSHLEILLDIRLTAHFLLQIPAGKDISPFPPLINKKKNTITLHNAAPLGG